MVLAQASAAINAKDRFEAARKKHVDAEQALFRLPVNDERRRKAQLKVVKRYERAAGKAYAVYLRAMKKLAKAEAKAEREFARQERKAKRRAR